jgi:hypothetical protein
MTLNQLWTLFLLLFIVACVAFWFGRYIERVDPLFKRRMTRIGYLISGYKDGAIVNWFATSGQSALLHMEQKRQEGYTCVKLHTAYADTREDEECDQ